MLGVVTGYLLVGKCWESVVLTLTFNVLFCFKNSNMLLLIKQEGCVTASRESVVMFVLCIFLGISAYPTSYTRL
jgi:hypothetical protein